MANKIVREIIHAKGIDIGKNFIIQILTVCNSRRVEGRED